MNTKPNPAPWRVTEPTEKKSREIVDVNGATVARLTALDLANAMYIVAAVNTYAESNKASMSKIEKLKSIDNLNDEEWEANIKLGEFALEQRDKPTVYYVGTTNLVVELVRRGVDVIEASNIIRHVCTWGNDSRLYPNHSLHSIMVYMHKDAQGRLYTAQTKENK